MTQEDFDSAKALQSQIDAITEVQAKNALSGATAQISVSAGDTRRAGQYTDFDALKEILGSGYDTIAATAKASIVSALASLKTSLQSDFDALGE